MKSRIKELRKDNKLTQQAFANKLGISKSNIESYELGRRVPTDAVIALICSKFNVSEKWLRTGEGEMYNKLSREDEISQMIKTIYTDNTNFRKAFIKILISLSEEELIHITNVAKRLADELHKLEETEINDNKEHPLTPEELERLYPPVDISELKKFKDNAG